MKTIAFLSLCLLSLILTSCKTKSNNLIDEICSIKPNNWECKIYETNLDSLPIPNGLEKPKAIIEFSNSDKSASEQVFLFLYDLSKKNDLETIIQEKQKEANCIPIFFAENKENYIITSSCYVNSSFFSSNQNLKPAIEKLFTKYELSIVK